MALTIIDIQYIIPANRDNINENAIGQQSQYKGEVANNIILSDGPCLSLEVGDRLSAVWLTGNEEVSNEGTAILSVHNGYINVDSKGTVYNLMINFKLFPCIERNSSKLYSTNGDILNISNPNWTSDTQDSYFFEAIYGYWLGPDNIHYPCSLGPDFIYMEGHSWNNGFCKYNIVNSPELVNQDLLEGQFWFDSNYNPIKRTQAEIEVFAEGKEAIFFCPDKGKGLGLYKEKLSGSELAEVQDFFSSGTGGYVPPYIEKMVAWYPGDALLNRLIIYDITTDSIIQDINVESIIPVDVSNLKTGLTINEVNLDVDISITVKNVLQNNDITHVVFSIANGAVEVEFEAAGLRVIFVPRPDLRPPLEILIHDIHTQNIIESFNVELQRRYALYVAKPANGTITTNEGIDCGTSSNICSMYYNEGATVDLIAIADPGYHFVRFTGDCDSNGRVSMYGDRSVSAIFDPD